MKRAQKLALIGLSMFLASCTYQMEVAVSQQAGRVLFEASGADGFCTDNIMVYSASKPNTPIWYATADQNESCPRRFSYGELPPNWRQIVAPEPLKQGELYKVNISAPGADGYRDFQLGNADGPINRDPQNN